MWSIIFIAFGLASIFLYLLSSSAFSFEKSHEYEISPNNQRRRTQLRKNSDLIKVLAMLLVSNIIMAGAWYWHIKFLDWPILTVILISWGIALPEYILHVKANRMGHAYLDALQLRIVQTIMTLVGFVIFMMGYYGASLSVNQFIGFSLVAVGAVLVFSVPKKHKPKKIEAEYEYKYEKEEVKDGDPE